MEKSVIELLEITGSMLKKGYVRGTRNMLFYLILMSNI